jgi:hypothetical protein
MCWFRPAVAVALDCAATRAGAAAKMSKSITARSGFGSVTIPSRYSNSSLRCSATNGSTRAARGCSQARNRARTSDPSASAADSVNSGSPTHSPTRRAPRPRDHSPRPDPRRTPRLPQRHHQPLATRRGRRLGPLRQPRQQTDPTTPPPAPRPPAASTPQIRRQPAELQGNHLNRIGRTIRSQRRLFPGEVAICKASTMPRPSRPYTRVERRWSR